VALVAVSSQTLRAQEAEVSLDSWTIEVWPEYDKPSVLVIYGGTVAEGTAFPQRMTVPVPKGAVVNAVADVDTNGGLFSLEWNSRETPAGQDVVFELAKPQFVVEYYLDAISPPPSRSFDLAMIVPYAARQGSLSLRQPARASDMQIDPEMTQTGTDSLGNSLYSKQLGPLAARQELAMRVAYTKADADPSVAAVPAPAEQPAPAAASRDSGTTAWLPWLVGGLLAVLVGAIAVYLVLQWRQSRATPSRQARRKEARNRGLPASRSTSPSESKAGYRNAFCPRCGNKFGDADKFCRSCGAERH
jgi:hypothetical protein